MGNKGHNNQGENYRDIQKRFSYRSSLCGKIAYPTRLLARAALKRLKGTSSYKPTEEKILNAYLCEACQNWHVGHTRFKAKGVNG